MATTTPTVSAAPATATPTVAAPDPIRVERGHRTAWVITGVAALALAGGGLVAARTVSTSEVAPPAGSPVARVDAAESAHGHGSAIRTAAGPAVVAVPAASTVTGPVVHRTPPRGMADGTAAKAPAASTVTGPVAHRTPPRGMADDLLPS